MRCYIANTGRQTVTGSLHQCLIWGVGVIGEDVTSIVKVYRARGGEKMARVIAEVSNDGVRFIENGRYMKVSKLRRV